MIDFTNFRDHPNRKGFTVYFFHSTEQGDYFQQLLEEHDIWYERDEDEESEQHHTRVYFGIKKADMGTVQRLNNMAIGKFRDKFIPFKVFRWVLIVVSILVVGLAIAGYLLREG